MALPPVRTRYLFALVCLFSAFFVQIHGQVAVTQTKYIFGSEIELGGFFPSISTEISLNADDGTPGNDVDFERDLGFSDQQIRPLFLATWRASASWMFQLDYLDLDRRSTKTLEKEIEWPPGEGGEYYPVGATVSSFLEYRSSRISAAYIFRTSKKSELALALGFHLTQLSAGIGLQLEIGEGEGVREPDLELPIIPLPTAGIYWGIRLSDDWLLRLRADYFALSYDGYSGSLTSARVEGIYDFTEHWGLGVGLNYYELSLKADKENFRGNLDFGYWGPSAYVRYVF